MPPISRIELQRGVADRVGNVGTTIAFRVGVNDADLLTGEFEPELRASDLVGLPDYHCYVKLMMQGKISRPFSVRTLAVQ